MGKKQSTPLIPAKGDLVVHRAGDEGKFTLLRVKGATEDGMLTAVIEASKFEDKRVTTEVDPAEVVVNLGNYKDAPYGRVYGLMVEPLRKVDEIPNWGELHVYRKLKKTERKALRIACAKVYKELVKARAAAFLPITMQIRNKKGRWAGMYHYRPNADDSITLQMSEFGLESAVETLRHEAGHGVWYRLMPDYIKAEWLKLYTYYIKISSIKAKDIQSARAELVGAGSVRNFEDQYSDMSEEQSEDPTHPANVVDECLSHIHSNYRLDKKAIELLLASNDDLETYWPTNPIDLSEANPVISEYASTKPEEFFAEAFRTFLEGTAPKKVKKLMDRTIQTLSTVKEVADEEDE